MHQDRNEGRTQLDALYFRYEAIYKYAVYIYQVKCGRKGLGLKLFRPKFNCL